MRDIFREGKKVFLLSGILFLGFGVLWYFQRVSQWGIVFLILSLLMIFLFGYTIFFLRVPRRKTKIDPDLIYASADGFVMLIDEDCEAPAFLEGRVQKVLIFMHVASMHWNLSPIEGTVEYEKYQKGSLKNVMKESSWQTNEHQLIGIENKEKNIKILVSMIAGLIARRIRFFKKTGDALKQGETMGLIKYGSANMIFIPKDFEIVVKKGQKSRAGLTVVARRKK